ncbi:MAG: Crp/Fnr family transcriptional regulator [Gammaproteobacteria bacterium]
MSHEVVQLADRTQRNSDCPLKNCPFRSHCLQHTTEIGWRPRFSLLRRNQVVCEQGQPSDATFVVRSGSVKCVYDSADGHEQIVDFRFPGDTVEAAAAIGQVCSSTVIALESSSVCAIPRMSVDNDSSHDLFRILMAESGRQLHERNSHALVIGQRTARQRLAWLLVKIADKYAERGFSGVRFNLPMSRHDIANHLALAIETVSRLLSDLAREGLVEVHGRMIEILDTDGLRDAASLEKGAQSKAAATH